MRVAVSARLRSLSEPASEFVGDTARTVPSTSNSWSRPRPTWSPRAPRARPPELLERVTTETVAIGPIWCAEMPGIGALSPLSQTQLLSPVPRTRSNSQGQLRHKAVRGVAGDGRQLARPAVAEHHVLLQARAIEVGGTGAVARRRIHGRARVLRQRQLRGLQLRARRRRLVGARIHLEVDVRP